MNSGTSYKKFLGANGQVPKYFTLIQLSINNGQWSVADLYLKELKEKWSKLITRLQFSVERDEINNFQRSLARIKGFIEAGEKAGSLAELKEMEAIWDNLGK